MYKKVVDGRVIYSRGKVIQINGNWVSNPTSEMLAANGWELTENYIYEPSEEDRLRAGYEDMLENSREKFLSLMEDYFAANGTGEIKELAARRKAVRASLDSLGKIVQSDGDGTEFNPFKYWTEGTGVHEGEWWQCGDGNGYIWEAKRDGVPASAIDQEYWDIPAGAL